MRLVVVGDAQQRPHRQGNGEGKNHVGNQNAGKQEQAHAGGHAQPGVEAGFAAKGPHSESCRQQGQSNAEQCHRNTGRPIVNAKHFVGQSHHPVDKGRLFQISDTVEPGRDPVSGGQHGPGDLRLDRIHVVSLKEGGEMIPTRYTEADNQPSSARL